MRILFLLLPWLLLSLPMTAQADFADGMRAYKEGAYSIAFQRWRPLANDGNAKAQNNIGILYRRGLGVEKDPKEAVKWYRAAAEQGFAKAEFNLGLMYKQGKGVEKDTIEAVKWYKKSAQNGYARAQYALGLRYETGNGVSRDAVQSLKWLDLAFVKASGRFRRSIDKARDRVIEGLTDEEIQKASQLVKEFNLDS